MTDVLAAVKRYGDACSSYAIGGVTHERVTEAFEEVRAALAASATDTDD